MNTLIAKRRLPAACLLLCTPTLFLTAMSIFIENQSTLVLSIMLLMALILLLVVITLLMSQSAQRPVQTTFENPRIRLSRLKHLSKTDKLHSPQQSAIINRMMLNDPLVRSAALFRANRLKRSNSDRVSQLPQAADNQNHSILHTKIIPKLDKIVYICVEKNYCSAYLLPQDTQNQPGLKEVVYRIPLKQITENLSMQQITQVSRSAVVNTQMITGINRARQTVILRHYYPVPVSKKYWYQLKKDQPFLFDDIAA